MKKARIRVVVCGAAGRMGSEVVDFFSSADDLEVTHGVERKDHPDVGRRIRGIPIVDDLSTVIESADCVVDFTNPSFTDELLKKGKKGGRPLVIGTTNLSGRSLRLMKDASREIPIVLYPNMSPAFNVLFKFIPEIAKALGRNFDVSIFESHHRMKRDAPSGTARKLSQVLKTATGVEPQISSARIGDVTGEHVITFAGEGEILRFTHVALSRRAFASGALLAARFVVEAKPGLYSMFDVLKLR